MWYVVTVTRNASIRGDMRRSTQHYLRWADKKKGLLRTESVIVEAVMYPKNLNPETVKHSLVAAHKHELGLLGLLLKYTDEGTRLLESAAKAKGIHLEYEEEECQ